MAVDQQQQSQQIGMSLGQMYKLANSLSYFSKKGAPDKIWYALSEAARRMYLWIAKENKGFFIKWDYTSIAIVPNQDEYPGPFDLGQILRFSERDSTSILPQGTGYREITPQRLTNSLFVEQQYEGISAAFNFNLSSRSIYSYIGPYLDQADSEQDAANAQSGTVQLYKVRLAPMPSVTLSTELIYAARFLEIQNENSYNVIPPEGRGAMLDYAVADLLMGNNDDLADKYEGRGDKKREEFLTWVRERQFQQYETQEPYLRDMD